MAIRFHCHQCQQLLGIASRKAGTEIVCPKCGSPQTVPSEEAAAMMIAATATSARQVAPGDPPPAVDEGDPPLSEAPPQALPIGVVAIPPPISRPAPAPALPTARRIPPGTILYRRRTLYVHGLLFLLLAGGAFAAGYVIGRGDATTKFRADPTARVPRTVLVEGRLYYDTGTGSVAPDVGAVVIVLPADRLPETTLSIEGLRPRDPPPAPTSQSLREIEAFGGVYGRADELGAFRVVVPDQGRYRVLLISRQTTRAEETDADELDLKQMTDYFYSADALLGPQKYRWTLEEITPDSGPIEHNFGRSGAEPISQTWKSLLGRS